MAYDSGWTRIIEGETGNEVDSKFLNVFNNIDFNLNDLLGKIDNVQYFQFAPQATEPVGMTEGALYYDLGGHSFVGIDDIVGTKTNLGQELVERAFNPSATALPEGIVVRVFDGDLTDGALHIQPASAALLEDATAFGLTTSPLAIDGFGKVVTQGRANGVNTKGIPFNEPVFLSEAFGEITGSAPDIITTIGYVVKESTTDDGGLTYNNDGIIYVKPRSIIALPNVVAFMDKTTPQGYVIVANTPQSIDAYDPNTVAPFNSVIMEKDELLGSITAPADGIYDAIINFDSAFDSIGNVVAHVDIEVYDATALVVVARGKIEVSANGVSADKSFSKTFRGFKDNVYFVQFKSDIVLANFTLQESSFSMKSIDIR